MKEVSLYTAKVGSTCQISRCLSKKNDAYRLQEMGLCKGATLTILQRTPFFGALELALDQSRLCIALELAKEFLVRDVGHQQGQH